MEIEAHCVDYLQFDQSCFNMESNCLAQGGFFNNQAAPMFFNGNACMLNDQSLVEQVSQAPNEYSIQPLFFNESDNVEYENTGLVIGNSESPQDVTEYELKVYREMLEGELLMCSPQVVQTSITAKDRGLLVDFLCRVHYKCRLTTAAFYRCIGILDRLFMLVKIEPNILKLVGCASMLIASKIEGQTFLIEHAIELSSGEFDREMMVKAESDILDALEYQINFPTSFMFLSHLQRLSIQTSELVLHARYIIEVCASAIEFINVRPSAIASMAILATRIFHQIDSPWTPELEQYTGYSYSDLIGYVRIVHSLLLDGEREESVFMRRKYGSVQFCNVASFPLPSCI